ncbi:MAG: hypothetical protein WEE89_19625, partial [Gemmatimonadota bacterium]
GVFGLMAFITMIVYAFRASYRKTVGGADQAAAKYNALGQAYSASMLGYVVTGFFLSQGYASLLYVLIGSIIAFDTTFPKATPAASLPSQRSSPPLGRGGLVRMTAI